MNAQDITSANLYFKTISPVKLNCWKHHLGFIKHKISKTRSDTDLKSIIHQLLLIGNSQMDLYTGKLNPHQISSQVSSVLKARQLNEHTKFIKWIGSLDKEYYTLPLKDDSIWILRKGNEKLNYVHIHPGRYSPNTMRIKAVTLKSAILYSVMSKIENEYKKMAETINYLRNKYLNVPPIKSIDNNSSLLKIIELLKA